MLSRFVAFRIDKMKFGAMLVNVSRGGLVDTDSLFDGLETGQLGAVGLDVYEDEGEFACRRDHWHKF